MFDFDTFGSSMSLRAHRDAVESAIAQNDERDAARAAKWSHDDSRLAMRETYAPRGVVSLARSAARK